MVRGTAIRIAFKALKRKAEEAPRPLKVKAGKVRKAKAPRAAATYRGARRDRARESRKELDPLSPYRNWQRLWSFMCPDAPKTTRVLRGKPKFARNALGVETLAGFYPDFPRPSKSKRYSYKGKR